MPFPLTACGVLDAGPSARIHASLCSDEYCLNTCNSYKKRRRDDYLKAKGVFMRENMTAGFYAHSLSILYYVQAISRQLSEGKEIT